MGLWGVGVKGVVGDVTVERVFGVGVGGLGGDVHWSRDEIMNVDFKR